ncbi:hypothetical protein ID866_3965 [Astraeus odoratus]|nr:hypothetical protein ID866_3965 [Astraeus odoratus]
MVLQLNPPYCQRFLHSCGAAARSRPRLTQSLTLHYSDAVPVKSSRTYNTAVRPGLSRRISRVRYLQTTCVQPHANHPELSGGASGEPFTILFCGRDAFSCAVFRRVYEAKDVWRSLHIATNPDVKTGRNGSHLDVSPLKTLGETFGVPIYTIPKDKAAFRRWLPPPPFTLPNPDASASAILDQHQSHVLVTASFGRILPSSILRLFPASQRLNVHPSLLPAYRGPAPIQRALMAGETETGVCVIQMGEVRPREGKVVDQGGIWAVERMDIPGDATFTDMQSRLAESGGNILVQVLRDMLRGEASWTSLSVPLSGEMPHAPTITALDSVVKFSAHTATSIARLERAIGHQRALTVPHALPGGRSVSLAGLHAIPLSSELGMMNNMLPGTAKYSSTNKMLLVACAGGELLGVERLQTQDRAMLGAKDWWNGVKGMGLVKEGVFKFDENNMSSR